MQPGPGKILETSRGSGALGASARAFLRSTPASRPGPSSRLTRSLTSAVSDTFDQRELLTLLVLPFFLLAFALALSQSWRHPVRTALETPVAPRGTETAIAPPAAVVAPAPRPALPTPPVIAALPPEAPAAASPPAVQAPMELAPPVVRLPGTPPIVDTPVPVELAKPVPVLRTAPPAIALPEIALTAPVPALPTAAPEIARPQTARSETALPQIALAPPAFVLPATPPAITAPPMIVASPSLAMPVTAPAVTPPVEPSALPAWPRAATPPPPPPAQREAKLAPVLPRFDTETSPLDGPQACLATPGFGRPAYSVRPVAAGEDFGERLAVAAREQTGEFVVYNDAYRRMSFPMGDVHPMYGVCTDVLIRAYRAVGVDLQELVAKARVGSGDTSIQHRRVDTLRKFFAAKGASLPITTFPEDYRPGDVVSYHRPQNAHSRTHIAIVSDVVAPSGRLMIVHNRGWGPQLEDALFVDQITGHYRYLPQPTTPLVAGTRRPAEAAAGVAAASRKPVARPTVAKPAATTKPVVKAAFTPAGRPQATASAKPARTGLPTGPQ